ncbi:hypothetical protein INR49_009506 [Caranx melampygus]|nr:hypothetical protein INR49_009506 [Caranx melampygus]
MALIKLCDLGSVKRTGQTFGNILEHAVQQLTRDWLKRRVLVRITSTGSRLLTLFPQTKTDCGDEVTLTSLILDLTWTWTWTMRELSNLLDHEELLEEQASWENNKDKKEG